ncbi:MAG: hypothetical protein OQK82_05115 [Candidatus Pacearchaeota archaeon]|nr:hypothetical protein [Candidatus Pacearchaeota archaeon]
MKFGLGKKVSLFCMGSVLALSGCSNSDSNSDNDTTEAQPYYFVGTTVASGTELWKSDGTDAGTVLVKEINTHGHSYASKFTEVGADVYFSADDGIHGQELWKRDVNGETLVKDINPQGNSNINYLTDNNGALYFTAYDGTSYGLWVSDGTAEGTSLVHAASGIANLTSMSDGTLYFTLSNQLWKTTDGVTASQVNTINAFSNPSRLTAVGSQLYFMAYQAATGYELWSSDGTDAGTDILIDIIAGSSSGLNASYARLFSMNSKLYFTANDGTGDQFWESDGTGAGTVKWLDAVLAPLGVYISSPMVQTSSSIYFNFTNGRLWKFDGTTASEVTTQFSYDPIIGVAGDKVFIADNSAYGFWVTDGTAAGTINVFPNNYSSYRYDNTVVTTDAGLAAVIRVYDYDINTYVYQLWFSDGTLAGTSAIKDLKNTVPALYATSSNVYMSFDDKVNGAEPWVSDGTVAGTVLMADLNTSSNANSYPYDPAFMNNVMYFAADNGSDGYGLWRSDGTADGTYQVKDTNPDGEDYVYNLTVSGGKLYFTASSDEFGYELWVSDGTEAGTNLVVDLNSGNSDSDPEQLTDVNGTLYFEAMGFLWKTDGTGNGTALVSMSYPDRITAAGDKLFFVAEDDNGNNQVWVTDGTFTGTKMVKQINPDDEAIHYRSKLYAVGNEVYFVADDGANGTELWKSDGTEAGTVLAANINPVGDGFDVYNSALFVVDDVLYFTAEGEGGDQELWMADDSSYGAVRLSSFSSDGGQINTNESSFGSMNGELYFSADDGITGYELWKSDGTVAGTVMVKDIAVEADGDSSYAYGFTEQNGLLYFIADDGVHGSELWTTDGTQNGTTMIKDVRDGPESGSDILWTSEGEGGGGD